MVPDDPTPRATSPIRVWQPAYEAVLKETDKHALFKLVEIAQAAVLTRTAELEGSADHHAERKALHEALSNLQLVKRDWLKFR